ncbi:preprotein translocase subunit SecG [Candidatus Parcubacteria bacterium]|nr:preprotein translocase subunit SecG [Patescibacteria group bacterium]MCG2688894.1 preprotein translocase subunit SecG [Candidatus Parcubacteria bacterium]
MKTNLMFFPALLITSLQILLSLLLITLIILQGGGAGLSSSSGYANYFATKRGFDRYIFFATIAVAIAFVAVSTVSVFIK